MMLKTETFFFQCYKLAKLHHSTFFYTEMAGKLKQFVQGRVYPVQIVPFRHIKMRLYTVYRVRQ